MIVGLAKPDILRNKKKEFSLLVLFFKALGIWLLLVITAIINATLREKVLLAWIGKWSLPVSGISLSLLIFLVTLAVIPLFATHEPSHYWLIGSLWLMLTLSFEFLFGHYQMGKSWQEILEIFAIQRGNLMTVVLIITFLSPYLTAQLRELI